MNTDSPLLKYLIIGAVVGIAAYFIARPYFVRASDMEWEHTVATYPDHGPAQAYVHGWTNAPLAQCRFSLLWKAGDDQWLVYDVEQNGAAWNRYQLRPEGELISVVANGKPVGLYDPKKGEYRHLDDKHVDKTPVAIIHGTNLDHEKQWDYYSGGK